MLLNKAKTFASFLFEVNFVSFKPCFLLLCIIAFQLPAQTLNQQLNDLPIIEVDITSMDFPPNAHRTEKGRVSGKSIETIRAFCRLTRMNCEVIIYPTARAYMLIENNSSDVLLTLNTPALKRCCTYAKWSYPFVAGMISPLKTDKKPFNKSMLEGQSLAIVRGWKSVYVAYPDLKQLVATGKVELIETSSIASAVKVYNSGRATFLWGANVFEWYFEQMSLDWNEQSFNPLVETDAGIWISKSSNHHQEILRRFNLAFQLLSEQGSLDQENFLIPSLMKHVYIEGAMPD